MAKSASQSKKVRYAVVGLGHIAQVAVLPAFSHTTNCELTALVSGDPVKRKELSDRYKILHSYSYEQYTECLQSGEVDAVYIALPDSMHCSYSVRAALMGVHVLCEKPMANSVDECEQMIRAARDGAARLMIAYRLHFDIANIEAIEIARSGKLGDVRLFHSINTQNVAAGNVRLLRETGRGPLFDMGVYCINAARYLFADEPIEVFCQHLNSGEERFREVPEMSAALLRFPGERTASFTCGYGASGLNSYQIVGTKGDLRMQPAFAYAAELRSAATIDSKTKEKTYPIRDQFAPELDYFADCIQHHRDPEPSGIEGLADIRIIEALCKSAAERHPVSLPDFEHSRGPLKSQKDSRPPVEKPALIHVKSPTGEE